MIKICHILSGDLWAGAEVMAYNLVNNLRKYDDIDLSVILLNNGRLAEEVRKLHIPLEVYEEKNHSLQSIFWKIRHKFLLSPPDVVHSHRYKENILACLVSLTIEHKNIFLLATQHSLPENRKNGINIKRRFILLINTYILSRYFQNVVAVSTDIKNVMEKLRDFPKNKIKVIHNGIVMSHDIPPREQRLLFTIGSLGRLVPVKNFSFFVEVGKELLKYEDHFRFELGGDGPELQHIDELISKYNLHGKFILKGNILDTDKFYGNIDLYMNTSLHEGIPMSVLEAMSYGLPIIAPNVGGIKEILDDGVQGYLMDTWQPGDYAEKCSTLFNEKKMRFEMGNAARKKAVECFSCDKMTQNYYNLYTEIIKRGNPEWN